MFTLRDAIFFRCGNKPFNRYSKAQLGWMPEFFTHNQLYNYENVKFQDQLALASKPDQI